MLVWRVGLLQLTLAEQVPAVEPVVDVPQGLTKSDTKLIRRLHETMEQWRVDRSRYYGGPY